MIIDLRSDTLTKPTPAMLDAMMSAKVGDDVFGEDPTVSELEEKGAAMLGFDAGLFCPSGTMTNQIAIRVLTQPQDEVICDRRSHIYLYEGGGIASNAMVSVELIDGDRGRLSAEHIAKNVKPDDIHFPKTRLVALENTVNKGGGCYYSLNQFKALKEASDRHDLVMHLDGARLFNALVETGDNPKEIGKLFDTTSICLSKGLGAPVGSLLLSSRENISKARRVRKVFGGAMRQAGYLAAAGIYALDNHINRLHEDHKLAGEMANILSGCPQVIDIEPVDTNIVIFTLADDIDVEDYLNNLKRHHILALGFGGNKVRMVTHLDLNFEMLDAFSRGVKSI